MAKRKGSMDYYPSKQTSPKKKMEKNNPILYIILIISYVFAIVMNSLANILKFNGNTTQDVSDKYQNLFTPSPYTFWIWFIIYIALGIFVFAMRKEQFRKAILIGLSINLILNGLWLLTFHYEWIIVSVIIMLLILVSLIYVYLQIHVEFIAIKTIWNIRIPISIYLGWISIATIANISLYLVQYITMNQEIWFMIICIIATFLGIFIINLKNDPFIIGVFIWAFIGILVNRLSDGYGVDMVIASIIWSLVFLIFELVYYFVRLAKAIREFKK